MLLETIIHDDVYVFIDAEPAAGIAKGGVVSHSPDMALENMLKLAGQVTTRLREAIPPDTSPDEVEISFAVRVDSNAAVSIARQPTDGQFHIVARWNKTPSPA